MLIPPLTAFDGPIHVHYGQAYVLSPQCDAIDPVEAAFAGQVNGLCGATIPGGLFLVTGLHTGRIRLRVQVHHAEPPVDDEWEDVVEASWTLPSGPASLQQWAGEAEWPLPLEPGSYRVRWCARNFGQDPEDDDDEAREPVEHYALLLRPAPAAPDAVLRQRHAGYWNAGAWPTMKNATPPPRGTRASRAKKL